ncbi:MAG TPA: ribbon-helix-helix domain-containing protein [Candidatus Methylacidiphilales bacterium]
MKAVLVYFPEEMVRWIDSAARTEDTDRSKFVRKAVRDFLEKHSRAA